MENYFGQGQHGCVRLHEKRGKLHSLPCHSNLKALLDKYVTAAGIAADSKGPLFRTAMHFNKTEIGCHTFRTTGITTYLKNGGRLEVAQQMANHESARTTGLYDGAGDPVSLDQAI